MNNKYRNLIIEHLVHQKKDVLGALIIKNLKEKLEENININEGKRSIYNSEGNLIANTQEEIDNFYKWFGNSKVVDKQGRPLVVYHGTGAEFDTFDMSLSARAFFTDSKIVADTYQDFRGKKQTATTMPVYLKLNNPLFVDFNGNSYRDVPENIDSDIQDYLLNRFDSIDEASLDEIIDYADEETNHDGVVAINIKDYAISDTASWEAKRTVANDYIVFEPTQIKSVNNRTFNSKSNNIYESIDQDITLFEQDIDKILSKYTEVLQETTEPLNSNLPNKNSLDQPIADNEEALKNFWDWFGDSKVMDDEGRPLVLYHGTNAKFDTFDKNKFGTKNGQATVGFNFSIYEFMAKDYGSNLLKVYLNAHNLFSNDTVGNIDVKNFYKKYMKGEEENWEKNWEVSKGYLLDKFRSASGVLDLIKGYTKDINDTIRVLKELGFDGTKDGHIYTVFEPEQIYIIED